MDAWGLLSFSGGQKFVWEKNLYGRQLVKKFTFSIVDVETSCRICKEAVDLEELWDHVERCMEVRRINYWHERQRNDTKQCLFCKQWVTLFEMEDHVEECRWKDCVEYGLRIEKLVKDWVVFRRCGHVVCRACNRRLERCDNGKKVICVKCRE
ncbi:unnamed protein product [Brachionus calyciflorus]|uniref:RING-type domain-containing protein n=1 Tax=Brachionus calyciflorus TaxID=104777 RepID=A0A814BR14_9BILA|nr:unnamed protein product [Brachionus calyciflorus]